MTPPAFGSDHYVPLLKTKAGELSALRTLDPSIRRKITPVFDVIPLDEDDNVDDRARKLIEDLRSVTFPNDPYWVDFRGAGESGEDVEFASLFLGAVGSRPEIPAVPVVAPGRPETYSDSVRRYVSTKGSGVAVRLDAETMSDPQRARVIRESAERVGVGIEEVDLVLDLGRVTDDKVNFFATAAAGVVLTLADIDRFRTVTLAASAFPEFLSGQGADSIERYPRSDWHVWRMALPQIGTRRPAFGDYGTESPALPTGLKFGPSPHIRYTLDSDWLVVKGNKNVGHEGFHEVASRLVEGGEFLGSDYSPGDRYLAERAEYRGGPGGPQQWRQAGTSHHLTHVVRQLESLPDL